MKYINEDKIEKEKKEEFKKSTFFEPFTSLGKGVGSVFKFSTKIVKPSESERKKVGESARFAAYLLYHYYKKANKLLSW